MEFLTEEQQEQAKIIIDCIKAFEDGDDSRYYDILAIIKAIKHFKNGMKNKITREKMIIALSRFKSSINGCLSEEVVSLYSQCDSYLGYYNECGEVLDEYLECGEKTGDYPDLEAAYLLTIYLSGLLHNIADYIKEIGNIARSYVADYTYYRNPIMMKRCEERKSTVTILVNSLKREELKKTS